jgi:hypothetical protein
MTRHRSLLAIGLVAVLPFVTPAVAAAGTDNVVLRWNEAILQAIRNTSFRPMWAARALAATHSAMYDAWAPFDNRAIPLRAREIPRRPRIERTLVNKEVAVSFAAYRLLTELFPSQRTILFDPLMAELGLDPSDLSTDLSTPVGIGNAAAAVIIEFCHSDGANQLGNINGGAPYSDYTGYNPVNTVDSLTDPTRWQPLRNPDGSSQVFLAPHWHLVTPFALRSADQFRPRPPADAGTWRYFVQAEALRRLSAGLSDRDKVIAEYWADGPSTETPPGHWNLLAQFVSRRDQHTLDQDVQLYFALGNALLDASISVWEAKIHYDYVRPVTALRYVFRGQTIEAWAGPHLGTGLIPGENWRPYIATPPFAEYTSGHSAFSAAAAEVLTRFTGSQRFGASFTFRRGASTIEPGTTPRRDVTLFWQTFDDAADEAGLSRRLGGIHFRQGDMESRKMGEQIGKQAFEKAMWLVVGGRKGHH